MPIRWVGVPIPQDMTRPIRAGKRMWLIIRHACGLRKLLAHKKSRSLQGEVVVRLDKLKTYATLFYLAYCNAIRKDPRVVKQFIKVLEQIVKYYIFYKY